MTTILGASASGLQHNQAVLDTVAHNIANANTAAFKRVRALAEGAPSSEITADGGRLGVADTTRDPIFSVGAPQPSDDPLHFAISDDTFFRVTDSDGSVVFTRFGALGLDAGRNITAFRGRLLEPPITLPEDMSQPAITPAGVVSALDSSGARQEIGRLALVRFMNPRGLFALGDGLYAATENSGLPVEGEPGTDGFGLLVPGAVEGSNVEIAEEIASMLVAQRAYQACARTFSIGDDMLRLATDLTQ